MPTEPNLDRVVLLVVDGEGGLVAVGPFRSQEEAHRWEDANVPGGVARIEHEARLMPTRVAEPLIKRGELGAA